MVSGCRASARQAVEGRAAAAVRSAYSRRRCWLSPKRREESRKPCAVSFLILPAEKKIYEASIFFALFRSKTAHSGFSAARSGIGFILAFEAQIRLAMLRSSFKAQTVYILLSAVIDSGEFCSMGFVTDMKRLHYP